MADIKSAVDWYTSQLGFSLRWRLPNDGGGENCMIQAGEVHFPGTLYFEMSGVQELYDRIKDNVQMVWPLETMDYGTFEFGIRDRDGYILAFAEQVGDSKRGT